MKKEDFNEQMIDEVVSSLTPKKLTTDELVSYDLAEELQIKDAFTYTEADDDLKEKIAELQEIAKSIEERVVRCDNFNRDKKYKVAYERELNQRQLIAVTYTEKPLLVIAGAGSGKTRVITYKVSYLIEEGLEPGQILILTFTKKAASEMINRVQQLLADKKSGSVLGGTFHRFSNSALRQYGKMIDVSNNFNIIDPADAEDIIDLLKTELKISGKKKGRAFPKKATVQSIISKSVNLEWDLQSVMEKFYPEYLDFVDEVGVLNNAFKAYKKASNIMDYDDLMTVLRDKLRDNEPFRNKLQESIKYILVDEFQDTNNIQREIVELLAGKEGRLTVVGDDSQSIYAFRGSNFENILRFPQSYPDCGVVKLEENYRSHQKILDFANDVIDCAKIGFKKHLFSRRDNGNKPVLRRFPDPLEEAEYIVDKILEIRDRGLEYSDFAVLSRASWHTNYVQAELMKRNIPYIVVGGIKFVERRHIKDIMSFMKIVHNPLDAVAWHRLLKLIDGIGNVRAKEIVDEIHRNHGHIRFKAFERKKYYSELKSLENVFKKVLNDRLPVPRAIEAFVEFYKPILKKLEDDYESRIKDIEVFEVICGKYNDFEKFLTDFTLEPPSNSYQNNNKPLIEPDDKPMVVSTVHSAKGLEWHTVFIPFAIDGLFPSVKSINNLEEIEEERRLFYVACTRAEENLFITMPSQHQSWDAVFTLPSRFIYDVADQHYEIEE